MHRSGGSVGIDLASLAVDRSLVSGRDRPKSLKQLVIDSSTAKRSATGMCVTGLSEMTINKGWSVSQ